MTATCRTCGAPIIWAATAAGNRMPLDAEPTAEGTFAIVETGGHPIIARLAADDDRLGFTSHFATCPQAGEWRRPR